MKKSIKKIVALMLFAFVAVSLFSCSLKPETELKFTSFPEAEYVVGETNDAAFLEAVKVELDGREMTLQTLKDRGATVSGINLNEIGSYTLTVTYRGATIVFEYDVVSKNEVKVNGVEKLSLVDAVLEVVESAEPVEFVLLKNVKVAENTLKIAKKANIKLDLNGKTLFCVSEYKGGSWLLENNGTLEIVGTSGSISFMSKYPDTDWGDLGFPGYACNTIRNNGTLTVNGDVVIENQTPRGGASYAIDNYGNSTLTIEKGTIKQSGGDLAIRMFSGSAGAPINVTINGGTIVGRRAIWVQLASSNSAVAPTMNLTINGGDFSTTDANQPVIYEYSYGNSHVNTNIVINGGTFNSSSIKLGAGYYGDAPQLTVNGGTFAFDVIRLTSADTYEVLYNANK